jgi:uncharacterized protein
MGFANFGAVSFTNESKVAKFVDYLEQGKIMGTKCQTCGARYFPPQMDCSKCMSNQMDWFEVNPNSKLVSYTLVRYGPAGFEKLAPYVIAIGETADGLRVLAFMNKAILDKDIAIGMNLKLAPVKLEGDRVSFEFTKD